MGFGASSVSVRPRSIGFTLVSLAIILGFFALIFGNGLLVMVARWSSAEYSHGYMIPFIALFFLWRDRHQVAAIKTSSGAWSGTLVVLLGLVFAVLSNQAANYSAVPYAFIITLFGLALRLFGWQGMRFLWFPLIFLIFMIPLPEFVYRGISSELQLIAAQFGVAVIHWFGISVYLSGNLIDLGVVKLHVAEACSGMRYLFPIVSFGFLITHIYQGPLWHRVVFFASTIPITILMNSFRVGIIGVLVEFFGIELAEGFLHYFEGWLVFMVCLAILYAELLLLMRISGIRYSLFSQFQTRAAL
jgi:exosortase D (VPLPA-CTERM-specific)